MFADDLVMIAVKEELRLERFRKRENRMEMKGLRVIAGMTKVSCKQGSGQIEEHQQTSNVFVGKELVAIKACA